MSYVTPARLGKFKELEDAQIAKTYLPLAGGAITGDILPSEDNKINLGSSDKRFAALYAVDLKLSTNSLYLGDTKILGTEQNTINIKADAGQSLTLKSQGSGYTNVESHKGINLETVAENGSNPDASTITIKAAGDGSSIALAASTIGLTGATTISNLTVSGNLTVGGTTTAVNSTNLEIEDNLVELNKGETGNGVSAGTAGIKIDRGDLDDYFLVFDESDDKLKGGVGASGVKAIATEDYVTNVVKDKLDANSAAASADKLNTNAGSVTQPIYFSNGVPVATSYTLEQSVTTDSKLTDTITTATTTGSGNAVTTIEADADGALTVTKGTTFVEAGSAVTNISVSGTALTFEKGDSPSSTIYTQDTTYVPFSGTDGDKDGANGLVPAPKAADNGKFLQSDGTWGTPANTITTASTTGEGNAVTAIEADENGAITVTKGATFLTEHQDISGKADKATTLAGYGITDAKIADGTITLGENTITPLTEHQDITGKADKATTLAGYGITDAKIADGVITLGENTITPLTAHQDISGKADKATTLAGYGITDAKIAGGVITLGENTITPLTEHQDISGKADLAGATFTGSITVGSGDKAITLDATTGHIVFASGLEIY